MDSPATRQEDKGGARTDATSDASLQQHGQRHGQQHPVGVAHSCAAASLQQRGQQQRVWHTGGARTDEPAELWSHASAWWELPISGVGGL